MLALIARAGVVLVVDGPGLSCRHSRDHLAMDEFPTSTIICKGREERRRVDSAAF